MDTEAVNATSMAFKKELIKRILGAELSHYLGYSPGAEKPGEVGNHPNDGTGKKVLTEEVPPSLWSVGYEWYWLPISFLPTLNTKKARRCYALDQLACLHRPEQWPDLRSFAVIESQRCVSGKTSTEQRFYLSSLAPDAARLGQAIRAHWSVENRLHWCMDVAFADDQMRARTGHAAHNLAVLKHITLNLIRLDPTQRKGGIKARRLIAATSDLYRAQLLGLA